ncbi:MAG: adenosylcobinamide-phosphate synthase CbiB [Zoogloeaceae bacterium]|nr:adenosylcobinamide-phosphate synthase CbiB [Zoogloeaceae bacterium]
MPELALKLALGLLLDRIAGEPPNRLHPLVAFGRWAAAVEVRARRHLGSGIFAGLVAWCVAVLPWCALALLLRAGTGWAHWPVDVALLWFALGARSLREHAEAVAAPLAAGDLCSAREQVSRIVSRDAAALDNEGVARAATESVLENGHDAIFSSLFWFCVAGGLGALLARLANTLDAMWGYRTPRYLRFGRIAARVDDVLGWIPARLTALTYAALGHTRHALHCWRTQAPAWSSPNAGPVMAAGAGALGVRLGGPAPYHGQIEVRPPLGCGNAPTADTIRRAVAIVRQSVWLWLAVVFVVDLATRLTT